MVLVIDVGNTSIAMGLWSPRRMTKVRHIDGGIAKAIAAADEYRADEVVYVSVVPKVDAIWHKWAKSRGIKFRQIDYRDYRNKLDYPHPESIGADRLCDATAAIAKYGTPVIVMDFGTALTAAAITSDGVWRGGVIAPGFPLMRDYLFERTAKLPKMQLGTGKAPKIGRSTEEAMRFGALVGYRGMVKEIVATLQRNFKADFKLVATGGFAKWALKDAGMNFKIDSTLTLFGAGLMGRNEK